MIPTRIFYMLVVLLILLVVCTHVNVLNTLIKGLLTDNPEPKGVKNYTYNDVLNTLLSGWITPDPESQDEIPLPLPCPYYKKTTWKDVPIIKKSTTSNWQMCGNLCFIEDCSHWGWDPSSHQCVLFGTKTTNSSHTGVSSVLGDINCPVNDCSQHHFDTWHDLIGPCFQQKLNNHIIDQPEFCSPEPNTEIKTNIEQAIQKLNITVHNSPELTKLSKEMYTNIPPDYKEFCPVSFEDLLAYLKIAMSTSPPYLNQAPDHLGVPLQNILICVLHTQSGRIFFSHPDINLEIVNIVDVYGKFLSSPDSLHVFNDLQYGWQNTCARELLNMTQFQLPNPEAKAWGFTSFNDWFTRNLSDPHTLRPCDESPTALTSVGDVVWFSNATDVKLDDPLYIKSETYSLLQMFGSSEDAAALAEPFVGGALLQVFFSAHMYHHFHSPASGTVLHTQHIPGIIYAIDEINTVLNNNITLGKDLTSKEKLDRWIDYSATGLYNSELYLAHVAMRCLIVMDSPELGGRVALIFIGMVEISSCKIRREVVDGSTYKVDKGEELGYFQYGGSSGVIVLSKDIVERSKKGNDFWGDITKEKKEDGWKLCEKILDVS